MAKAKFASRKQLEKAKEKGKGVLSYRKLKDGRIIVASAGIKRRKTKGK